MRTYLVATLIGLLISAVILVALTRAESVPYGGGCVTTVVIKPDGSRMICTTCPTGNGLSVTICQ